MKAESVARTRRCFEARRKVALARWEVAVPEWTVGGPFEATYRAQRRLYLEGEVRLACFVKANRCLYERNECMASHWGVTVLGRTDPLDGAAAALEEVSRRIIDLREEREAPDGPDEEALAAFIQDDWASGPFRPLPASLSLGLELMTTDTSLHKELLPEGHLARHLPVPLLVHPELRANLVVPFEYWSDELLEAWGV